MDHRFGDERIAEWLRENRYHPRSPKHGSVSCLYLLDDLSAVSDLFREAAQSGEIAYQEDYTVGSGASAWNTDLVVGPPEDDVQSISDDRTIGEGTPERVWLAIDAKSVMTEHGKARRNRQRDINSFADIMHRHHPGAVTGGVLLINLADRFRSPLRDEGDITDHENIDQLVEETVEMFRDIERAKGKVSPNVDGVGCVVVDHDNIKDGGTETELVTDPPAPQSGDIVHYPTFVENTASVLEDRWLTGSEPDLESFENADIESVLNRQVVEVASAASDLAEATRKRDVDESLIQLIETEIEKLEAVVSEIERRHEED